MTRIVYDFGAIPSKQYYPYTRRAATTCQSQYHPISEAAAAFDDLTRTGKDDLLIQQVANA